MPQIEETQVISESKQPSQVVGEGKEALVKSIAQTAQEIENKTEEAPVEGPENLIQPEVETSVNEAKE